MSARQLVVNSTLKHTQSHYGYYKTSQTMFLPLVFIIIPRENFFNIRAALLNFLTAQQVFFYIGLECYYFKSVWTFWKFTTFAAFSVFFHLCIPPPNISLTGSKLCWRQGETQFWPGRGCMNLCATPMCMTAMQRQLKPHHLLGEPR